MAGLAVFFQHGCPACDEFSPRVKRMSFPYRVQGLTVAFVDVNGQGEGARLGQKYKITATPTTIAWADDGWQQRIEGSLPDENLRELLDRTTNGVK